MPNPERRSDSSACPAWEGQCQTGSAAGSCCRSGSGTCGSLPLVVPIAYGPFGPWWARHGPGGVWTP
eukprot:9149439-Heterocapsa_arctica.AAC.1